MAAINIFDSNAFSMFSLTAALNKVPHQPKLLGSLNLFRDVPIRTLTAAVEDKQGTLALLVSAARGDKTNARSQPIRTIRDLRVPHYPQIQTILADDIQGIRAFGSESELEGVADVVNTNLEGMRENHETSLEFGRLGAIKGTIVDGDNSTTIYDLFTEFGTTQQTQTYDMGAGNDDMKLNAQATHRLMATALGQTAYTGIIGICGDRFFDSLVSHANVTDAFTRWIGSDGSAGSYLRQLQSGSEYAANMNGFPFANIFWINYRGVIGDVTFVADNKCHFIATGVRDLFQSIMAPANFLETVHTPGKKMYAKQRRLDYDEGVELFTQHNVLHVCTRPRSLIEATATNIPATVPA